MEPCYCDSQGIRLRTGAVVHPHIATGPFNCLAFGHHWGVSGVPRSGWRLPQCSLGLSQEVFLSQNRWPLIFHELGYFWECAALTFCWRWWWWEWGGGSVFDYVHKFVRKKHCTCDTRYGSAVDAQACTHTYINSCQLLPDLMRRGHSASSMTPTHTHILACMHAHTFFLT